MSFPMIPICNDPLTLTFVPLQQPRPLPTPEQPSDLENLAPVPEIRANRLRTDSDDSTGAESTTSVSSISHLPPLPPTFHSSTHSHSYTGKTSEPTALQSSIGYSLSKLLTLPAFTAFLSTQNGYQGESQTLLCRALLRASTDLSIRVNDRFLGLPHGILFASPSHSRAAARHSSFDPNHEPQLGRGKSDEGRVLYAEWREKSHVESGPRRGQ